MAIYPEGILPEGGASGNIPSGYIAKGGGKAYNNGSNGNPNGTPNGGNAGANTGGGGGGATYSNNIGGDGGSGIVIIKFSTIKVAAKAKIAKAAKLSYSDFLPSYTNASLNFIYNTTFYIAFTSGTGSITFTKNTVCNILVVGGGGSGAVRHGGGGGAGAFISKSYIFLAEKTYNITIGAGGEATINQGIGNRGNDTYIRLADTDIFRAKGGGGGGQVSYGPGYGYAGGSGGGSSGGYTGLSEAPLSNLSLIHI